MDHRLAHLVTAAAAAVLVTSAPAIAYGGDTPPSESAAPHASHDTTGHEIPTPHDHTGTGTGEHGADGQGADHEQSPDDVSPEMRRLVLTGFASVNGAVIVAAFLIRRTSPTRTRRSTR